MLPAHSQRIHVLTVKFTGHPTKLSLLFIFMVTHAFDKEYDAVVVFFLSRLLSLQLYTDVFRQQPLGDYGIV